MRTLRPSLRRRDAWSPAAWTAVVLAVVPLVACGGDVAVSDRGASTGEGEVGETANGSSSTEVPLSSTATASDGSTTGEETGVEDSTTGTSTGTATLVTGETETDSGTTGGGVEASSGSGTHGSSSSTESSSSGEVDAVCGDGARQGREACDGDDFGDATCPIVGPLSCTEDCMLDLSACTDALVLCSAPGAELGQAQTANSPLVDTVTVNGDAFVVDVEVSVDITHPWVGDLTARLEAPDPAAASLLFDAPCGMAADIDARFDDEGAAPVCGDAPALFGDIQPSTELQDLIGVQAQGPWSFVVWDTVPFVDDGTQHQWCLELTLAADDPVVCGDDVAHFGEACDGADLNGFDCSSVGGGFTGGTLACGGDCSFDTAGCVVAQCGDGILDPGEACDGAMLGGQTCDDVDGFTGSGLACGGDCTLDTSGCEPVVCGDGSISGDEICDPLNLAGAVCEDFPGQSSGVLGCAPDCATYDLSGCISSFVEVCSSPGSPINEVIGTTNDEVTVVDAGTVSDVDVFVDITHTWVGDLQIALSSPAGTSVSVFEGCDDVNDIVALFDDDGDPLSCGGIPGVSGAVAPNEPLGGFAGEAIAGDWQLAVTDVNGGDSGTLNTWCVQITPQE